jgi:hypothetical protein
VGRLVRYPAICVMSADGRSELEALRQVQRATSGDSIESLWICDENASLERINETENAEGPQRTGDDLTCRANGISECLVVYVCDDFAIRRGKGEIEKMASDANSRRLRSLVGDTAYCCRGPHGCVSHDSPQGLWLTA